MKKHSTRFALFSSIGLVVSLQPHRHRHSAMSSACGGIRDLALAGELHRELRVDPDRGQDRRVLVLAEALQVGVREPRAACARGGWRVRWRRGWLASHQLRIGHVAYGLSIGAASDRDHQSQENHRLLVGCLHLLVVV